MMMHFDQCTGGEYEVILIKAVPLNMLLGQTDCFFCFFFPCSFGIKPFLVGLVDQLFQPAQNSVEMAESNR